MYCSYFSFTLKKSPEYVFFMVQKKGHSMENRDQKGRMALFVRQWWDKLEVAPPADEAYGGTRWPSIEEQPPSLELVLYFVRLACPNASFFIEEILQEQERAIVRWQLRGIDSQGFQGRVPTNRRITLAGVHRLREEDGHFVQEWRSADLLSLLLQFGFICLPQQPRISMRWHYSDTL